MKTSDFVITGGGIVGLASALRLQTLHPGASILVLEKEAAVAQHQSGRNSGVIHAGVYYAPGSHKARFCAKGVASTRAFCDEHAIPYRICGKLIVATDPSELERMATLESRARANGIVIERLSGEDARRLEPNIKAVAALLSPTTGIVDYGLVAARMAELFRDRGGQIRLGTEVLGGSESEAGVTLRTTGGDISAGKAVFCGGLHADRLARAFGASLDFRIVPFRGEYFAIRNQPDDLVQHLIYPVPDPSRPFLGVHLTRKMNGGFTVGPNAVLALKREGYRHGDVSLKDMGDSLSYPGFWKLMRRNAGAAVEELSASLVRSLYLRKVHKYCDRIRQQDLAPYRAGVRAQAVGADGRMIDDFVFVRTRHALHVCNAPSPAATSCLPIAEHIVDELMT
ncbi:L-2-hydroxyglutarate oxidase [Cereibacter sphaeroides]|uniref:L-2-hydroxyglutarate oxidase n=1 Tax=Cereibacter sphaeroides TaxID=1063 RepID=UPI001F3C103C|nr:L-2-hydroxyglutarate oxidase [Cereibacter sphaeroides]MCE6958976.1 L-2-hydroxyglutarate oxidase [Cereibacter sphaeroides]MCE6969040.1 L-2-hydroxyglutarate oxidase [Cereibacter sphaeroides]MCE6973682.1 L-2-hydroxyglutarate oxidase [Cereibacter sphaeroides]